MDRFTIRKYFNNQAITITLVNGIILHGLILRDESHYCVFVKNINLKEFQETKSESLTEKIKFKDIKSIDYQKK